MYLSYSEYVSMGGTLTETEFDRLNSKAQSILDLLTFNRITNVNDNVKECIFELIGTNQETISNVSSVSNDGYSITYKNRDDIEQGNSDIVYRYFAHTDMLYRGTD